MSPIEKVARAIAPSSWAALGTGDTLAHKNRRTASLRHARAALLAIREPDEGMIDAACAEWIRLYPGFEGEKPQPTAEQVVRAIFHAAIDHALTEETSE